MFDFVAIDFETADTYKPCSLGIAMVKSSEVVLVKHWYIKPICYPYFHFYAQKVHGIHKEDVKNEPEFDELWHEVEPYIRDRIIIAHNASFDLAVLRKTLKHYKLQVPQLYYYCTQRIAKKAWPNNKKSSLDYLCKQENIELDHHRADSDARACAELFIREMEVLGVNSLQELKKKHSIGARSIK